MNTSKKKLVAMITVVVLILVISFTSSEAHDPLLENSYSTMSEHEQHDILLCTACMEFAANEYSYHKEDDFYGVAVSVSKQQRFNCAKFIFQPKVNVCPAYNIILNLNVNAK